MLEFFRKMFGRREAVKLPPPGGPRHWKLRVNGTHAFILRTAEHGRKIVLSGWHSGNDQWRDGDYFILVQNSGRETRYLIEKIRRPGDPHDQYFAECVFAPRGHLRAVEG